MLADLYCLFTAPGKRSGMGVKAVGFPSGARILKLMAQDVFAALGWGSSFRLAPVTGNWSWNEKTA